MRSGWSPSGTLHTSLTGRLQPFAWQHKSTVILLVQEELPSPQHSFAVGKDHSLYDQLMVRSLPLYRRAYQRAVTVPTPALEQLWASYERFEQSGSNKGLGRCRHCYLYSYCAFELCMHTVTTAAEECQLVKLGA